uniref:Cytochrome P450 18 n=1 Tax=Streltzoviella insularis TaxID=1206366 RepID=A0A7D5YVQ0_9NEOP|nr:cytochrome P450 18 [Streltzoviella insularis]
MRFGKMKILAGLVTLLKKCRVELAPDTPWTVQYEPKAVVIQAKGDMNLKFLLQEGWEHNTYIINYYQKENFLKTSFFSFFSANPFFHLIHISCA